MRIRQIISVGLMLILLSACAPNKDPAVTTGDADLTTGDPDQTSYIATFSTSDPIEVPTGGIGEKTEQYLISQNEKSVLSVSLSLPVASITGDSSLQETLIGRLEAIETQIRQYVETLHVKYAADIAAGREGLTTPSIQVRFTLNYFTSEAASLTYLYNETTSEGRTVSYARFYNIDLRVGNEILLSALLKDGAQDTLIKNLKQAVEDTETAGLYEGQEALLSDLLNSRWYMTRTSIVFLFSPGDLAPVSSGEIRIVFDVDSLNGLLSDYGSVLIG